MADNSNNVSEVLTSSVENNNTDSNEMSLESLVLLINAERLKNLQETTNAKFNELKDKQKIVSDLHKVMKAINAATTEEAELNLENNEELKNLIQQAQDLGVDLDPNKESYTAFERERLVENIRMTVDDLNTENDMLLQEVSRLTNERYESYQLARTILKPLHDAKTSHARGMRGQ